MQFGTFKSEELQAALLAALAHGWRPQDPDVGEMTDEERSRSTVPAPPGTELAK